MEYEKEVSLGMEMLDAEEVLNKLEKKYEAL